MLKSNFHYFPVSWCFASQKKRNIELRQGVNSCAVSLFATATYWENYCIQLLV